MLGRRDDPYRELLVLTAGSARSVPAAEEDASLEDAVPEEMIEYPTGTFFVSTHAVNSRRCDNSSQ